MFVFLIYWVNWISKDKKETNEKKRRWMRRGEEGVKKKQAHTIRVPGSPGTPPPSWMAPLRPGQFYRFLGTF